MGAKLVERTEVFKVDTDNAELIIHGSQFGNITGSVQVIVQGSGKTLAPVLYWSDSTIVASVPVDETIKRVFVLIADGRGKQKAAGHNHDGEDRSSGDPTPAFTVTGTEDDEDSITVEGTDLDQVGAVTLLDNANVPHDGVFTLNGGELAVEWPAAYTSPIARLRLSDLTGDNTIEEVPAAPGLEAAPNGIVTDVSASVIGTQAALNIFGTDLGSVEGSVRTRKQGGGFQTANVLSGGWSDSLVQVAADQLTTYDGFEVTRDDGEVAALAATVPPTVTTPAVSTDLLVQATSPAPGTLRIVGNGMSVANRISTLGSPFGLTYYDPNGPNAASNGAVDTSGWTWTDGVIELIDPANLPGSAITHIFARNVSGVSVGNTLVFSPPLVVQS